MTLRTRLVGTTVLVLALALLGAGVATYTVFTRFQLRQVDARLADKATQVERLAADQVAESTSALIRAAPGAFVQVRERDGTTAFTTPARSSGDEESAAPDPQALKDLVTHVQRMSIARYRSVPSATEGDDLRLRAEPTADGGVLVVGESLHEQAEVASRLVSIEIVVALVTVLAAGAVGATLVGLGLRPLRRVERTALAIANSGDLTLQAAGAGTSTETGRLALAVNTMLDRIRSAFAERDATEQALRVSEQRMSRFVADVSHELRTPLAAMSAYAELVERGARDRPEDLDRALAGIGSETRRMSVLVEELLLLARLDQPRGLRSDAVDLSEIVLSSVATAGAIDTGYPIEVQLAGIVSVRGDAEELRRVVDNLLANVRTHTPAGTRCRVTFGVEDERAVLVVSDDGPARTAEQASRALERFYRGDPSRSRASGGSGLGLAIVDAVVAAHGGTVMVHTGDDGWTVRVAIPATIPGPERHREG